MLHNKVQTGANIRDFDFVRAPDGTNYVIAQYSQWEARLFKSRLQAAGSNGDAHTAWSEWCPQTSLDDAGASTSNWTAVGLECPENKWTFVRGDPAGKHCGDVFDPLDPNNQGEESCTIVWPTIAADDQDRLAISYYESDDTNTLLHVRVWTNAMPRSPTSSWQSLVVPLPNPPVVPPDDSGVDFDPLPAICADAVGCGTRSTGDYEGHTVRFGFGAPMCGVQGTFYPFWTVVNPPDVPFAQTVPITP